MWNSPIENHHTTRFWKYSLNDIFFRIIIENELSSPGRGPVLVAENDNSQSRMGFVITMNNGVLPERLSVCVNT